MAKRRLTKDDKPLDLLREAAAACTNCDLYRRATQTVFGAGPAPATMMFVGEQPGDAEDKAGEPFVGAAGRVLREALAEAGIDPADVYITNAVKHFKWKAKGKRRIHERPNREEVLACRMWLDAEIARVRPKAIIALGATAAGVIIGPSVKVTRDRARRLESTLAPYVTVTVHPSSILRVPDPEGRRAARRAFVADLKKIVKATRA
jgi:DNA polymerase